MKKKVTLHITSYNRPILLKNCVDSFFNTNLYPCSDLELVIVDNGSTNKEVVDYIKGLEVPCEYKFLLNEENDYPYCLRRAKNQAREIASGEYFIDCPDDHLFILRSHWLEDSVVYLETEQEKASCVCHYAYPAYRFNKPNNKMHPSSINSNYYVSELKGYADYNVIPKAAYEDIGKYREDLEFTPNAESEYMKRSHKMGYRRTMRKYPSSIINENSYKLIKPITQLDYEGAFSSWGRPVDNETLTHTLLKAGAIE